MSEPTNQDVLELARQRINVRQQTQIAERGQREMPWRYAFFGMMGALLLGLLAWPGAPVERKMYAVVHGVCAQIHNVNLGGMQLPICARNTGIYSSFLVTTLSLLALGRSRAAKLPPLPISVLLVLFVIIMGIDGVNSMFVDLFLPHLYTPRNWLRTLTGIGMGIAVAVAIVLVLNLSLRRDPDTEQPVIGNFWELGGILALNLLVMAAMYGNVALMFWPIAISAWVGIISVLFCANLLLTALLMGYEGRVLQWMQLVKPATFAVLFTVVELALLGSMRFWLEGQGLVVG